jgi:beta-glucanase (GH16 family)
MPVFYPSIWTFGRGALAHRPALSRAPAVRIETLEPRRLLAGAPLFDASFDFGPAAEPAIAGYFPDHGAVFGQRNGLEYGWTAKETHHARLRHSKLAADPRYDGLIAFGPGQSWELAVPDGSYQVAIALGDANTTAGLHEVEVEGEAVSFISTRKLRWQEWNLAVTITDGYLQVSAPKGIRHLKSDEINFLNVSQQPAVEAISAPAAPGNLTLVSATDTTAQLQWTPSAGGTATAGYQVYRGTTLAGSVGPGTTSFTDTDLTAGASYSYTVVAFDANGNDSPPSVALAVTTPGVPTALAPPTIAGNWGLTFDDEFNSLNTNVWTNGKYWWNGNAGTQATFEPNNVWVSDGVLSITAKRQATEANDGTSNPYSSGLLQTGGIQGITNPGFSFTYGYIETRAKIAPGQSMWSAFWMLPVSHQDDYELDLYENTGKSPYAFQAFDHDWPNTGKSVVYGVPYDLTSTWNTYGVDWEPNQITWYLNGKTIATYTDTSVIPEQPMYLILNLDVGGNFAGKVDANSPAESTWEVDYIRVWQH